MPNEPKRTRDVGAAGRVNGFQEGQFEPLLKDADVEALCSWKRGTLRSWRVRGMGPPFIRVAERMPRYRISDIEAWLATRIVKPGGAR